MSPVNDGLKRQGAFGMEEVRVIGFSASGFLQACFSVCSSR